MTVCTFDSDLGGEAKHEIFVMFLCIAGDGSQYATEYLG